MEAIFGHLFLAELLCMQREGRVQERMRLLRLQHFNQKATSCASSVSSSLAAVGAGDQGAKELKNSR